MTSAQIVDRGSPPPVYTTELLGIVGLIAEISERTWTVYEQKRLPIGGSADWFLAGAEHGRATFLFWREGEKRYGMRLMGQSARHAP